MCTWGSSCVILQPRARVHLQSLFLPAVVAVRKIGPEEVKLKQVFFMITLAHPVQALNAEGIVLAAPGVFSCEVIAEKVRDAFARPACVDVTA